MKSIVKAMSTGLIQNYWNKTETTLDQNADKVAAQEANLTPEEFQRKTASYR